MQVKHDALQINFGFVLQIIVKVMVLTLSVVFFCQYSQLATSYIIFVLSERREYILSLGLKRGLHDFFNHNN